MDDLVTKALRHKLMVAKMLEFMDKDLGIDDTGEGLAVLTSLMAGFMREAVRMGGGAYTHEDYIKMAENNLRATIEAMGRVPQEYIDEMMKDTDTNRDSYDMGKVDVHVVHNIEDLEKINPELAKRLRPVLEELEKSVDGEESDKPPTGGFLN